MDPARAAPVGVTVAGAAAVWLVPGLDPALGVFVAVLAATVAWLSWTGYGGPYLLLCGAEALAVGLGAAALPLGVLAQAPVTALVAGTGDRNGLLVAAGAALVVAATVLYSRHALAPLLVLAAAGTAAVLVLAGLEAWVRRRFSGGPA